MRPESLLGILLDLLEEFDKHANQPADVRLRKFFKARRYLGSHDRRFVGDGFFAYLRHEFRARKRWKLWSDRTSCKPPENGRMKHMGTLLAIAADGFFPWSAKEIGDAGATYAAAQGGGWIEILRCVRSNEFLTEEDWPGAGIERLACERSLPDWITRRLVATRGEEEAAALAGKLLDGAAVDVRVCLSNVDREVVRKDLETTFNIQVEVTPYSPAGLRIRNRINLRQFLNKHKGWIEVQDEASQIAALACEASPGETIIDACAGAGGKTLAFADLTGGDATLHACDIDAARLSELERRASALELRSLTLHEISEDPHQPLPGTLPSKAHLVVVDAPCSGLGSLRRNPDLKMRYDEDDIAKFAETQYEILHRFAGRVRPGGRLVYMTCSILPDENQEVAQRFLEKHPEFKISLPEASARLPKSTIEDNSFLLLDPLRTETDGFFVAMFRKARASGSADERKTS
jgi:16S rRNA (cytosine967-C5)-methyltransferase